MITELSRYRGYPERHTERSRSFSLSSGGVSCLFGLLFSKERTLVELWSELMSEPHTQQKHITLHSTRHLSLFFLSLDCSSLFVLLFSLCVCLLCKIMPRVMTALASLLFFFNSFSRGHKSLILNAEHLIITIKYWCFCDEKKRKKTFMPFLLPTQPDLAWGKYSYPFCMSSTKASVSSLRVALCVHQLLLSFLPSILTQFVCSLSSLVICTWCHFRQDWPRFHVIDCSDSFRSYESERGS